MSTVRTPSDLTDLPDALRSIFTGIRGKVTPDYPLASRTWFRVGGNAEIYFQPVDTEDLRQVIQRLNGTWPVTLLGACSNIIVRDGGIPGITIRLGRGFSQITREDNSLIVGAAALDVTVAETAALENLAGLEFLSGIPGSIGGAVRMNAGAYGAELSDVIGWAEIMTSSGEICRLGVNDLGLSYRTSRLPADAIVLRVCLHGTPGQKEHISARIAEIKASRENSQPVRARTGGSTFRNPPAEVSSLKAWQLIDAAGCRGLQIGGAQVSEKHCNFLINTGSATATDLETLGETVKSRVYQQSGIELHWEIRRYGVPSPVSEVRS
ncbi:MAG: UDP-N-acetylmuramate dehydrogenase [Acetobacter sp.]|jgi:UDP-N-acetylmuramate dehydrogenase